MSKYSNEVKEMLAYLGGKENIVTLMHCMTRLRFVLNDTSKANTKKIEELKNVKGVFTQAGQFQVIIGPDVGNYYKEFIEISGVQGESKENVKEAAKKNMNILQRIITNMSEIFAPLIPAIIAGGLILAFRTTIGDMKFFEDGTKSLIEISQFWSGVHSFLWLIGEAVFHYLPVGVVWSITKKMGGTQILGIVTGITLVSPQLLNAYAVGSTEVPFWNFGFAQVEMIGYQAQIVPAILVGFTLVYLERLFKKITPHAISMVVVPLFSVIISVLLAHTVLGPIGWAIGNGIATVIQAGFDSSFAWLFAGIYGFSFCLLVITGLHHTILPIDLQLIGSMGGTPIWPINALCGMAQASAVLAYMYLKRKDNEVKQVGVPACISACLGVAEPAIFGINLKYFYPFLAALIGSGVAGMISVITKTTAVSIGVTGIPAILSINPKNMFSYLIASVVSIVLTFVLTIIFSKIKLAKIKDK